MKRKSQKPKAQRPKPDGRSRYKPEFTAIAQGLVGQYGFDPDKLAAVLGVSVATVKAWADGRANFKNALAAGLETYKAANPDGQRTKDVEDALFKSAVGYNIDVTKTVEKDGEIKEVVRTTEHIPGSPKAQMDWLTNRDRLRWQNRVKVETTVKGPPTIIIKTTPDAADVIAGAVVAMGNDDSPNG